MNFIGLKKERKKLSNRSGSKGELTDNSKVVSLTSGLNDVMCELVKGSQSTARMCFTCGGSLTFSSWSDEWRAAGHIHKTKLSTRK